MKKSSSLGLLIALTLVAMVLVNQNWISAEAIETAAKIELTGAEISAPLTPLLVFALLIFTFGFYFKGQVSSLLFAISSLLLGLASFSLVEKFDSPVQTIIDSGELEKAIGQTGTVAEIAPLLTNLDESPAYPGAIAALFLLSIFAILTSISAWRWVSTNRSAKSERNSSRPKSDSASQSKNIASSFDLWDEQS